LPDQSGRIDALAYEHIIIERDEAVAVLSFNRPHVLNAFHNELMRESLDAMTALNADESVRAVVVRGAGRAFSAGFDLKAAASRTMDDVSDWERQMRLQFDFIMQFWDSPKPTVACVHGFCLAGAFEAMLACDVAAEGTRFGEPEVRFGTGIVAMLLPWVTGPKQAKELLLTGDDRIDAADALRLGIVNHVVPAGQEFDKAMALARTMARAARRSVRLTKRAINQTYETMGLRGALQAALDIDVILNSGDSPEKAEFARIRKEQGVKAALAWRDARFAKD
jgi:enoyl-CoA hydratase